MVLQPGGNVSLQSSQPTLLRSTFTRFLPLFIVLSPNIAFPLPLAPDLGSPPSLPDSKYCGPASGSCLRTMQLNHHQEILKFPHVRHLRANASGCASSRVPDIHTGGQVLGVPRRRNLRVTTSELTEDEEGRMTKRSGMM